MQYVHVVEYYSPVKKEHGADTGCTVDGPRKHQAEGRKPDTKDHVLPGSTCMKGPDKARSQEQGAGGTGSS